MWSGWCEEMVERINLETSQDLSKVHLLLIQHVQPDFFNQVLFNLLGYDAEKREVFSVFTNEMFYNRYYADGD